jgi:hypothetical protein
VSGGDEALAGSEEVPRDVLKKNEWLRRHAVFAPGAAVEGVEVAHGRVSGVELDTDGFLGFADGTAQGGVAGSKEGFGAESEVEGVAEEFEGRSCVWKS